MSKFYYVTVATGDGFIKDYTQYAIKSLMKSGISPDDIYFVGNSKRDRRLIKSLCPDLINVSSISEDLSKVVWKRFGGKRKYSLFKAAALYKKFENPIPDRYMIYFDGDVLWYKDPTPFFETKCEKTWFHHGKDLEKRASIKRKKVDIKSFDSLGKWCSLPMAHLMAKYGIKKLPDREVVAGFYLLHPRDHVAVLKLTYEGCLENADKFRSHEGCGDQKPMNAAINVLDIDWHGGSRFFCPEHVEYFDHFFGKEDMKSRFHKKCRKIGVK